MHFWYVHTPVWAKYYYLFLCRLRFPVILTVYMCISLLVSSCFFLAADVGRENVACTSKNLLENMQKNEASFYCRLLGIMPITASISLCSSKHVLTTGIYMEYFALPSSTSQVHCTCMWIFKQYFGGYFKIPQYCMELCNHSNIDHWVILADWNIFTLLLWLQALVFHSFQF